MKSLRSVSVVVAVIGMAALFIAVPFVTSGYGMCGMCDAGKSDKDMQAACKDMKESCEAKIKTLRDSAAALQATNPDMAKGLNDLADQKAQKMQEWADMQAKHDAKTKLLTDASAALKGANPALSKELQDMSEHKHMDKGWGKKKDHDDGDADDKK